MTERASPALLWGRACVLAGFTVFVGAAGHATSGGRLPGAVAMAGLLAVSTVLAASVLTRPATTRLVVGSVVVGQMLVHGVLSLAAGHAGDPAGAAAATAHTAGPGVLPTSAGHRVGSLQDHYDSMVGTTASAGGLTVPDPAALLAHAPMFVAHTAAAVVVGLWLAVGERTLWAVIALIVARVVPRLPMLTAHRPVTALRRTPPVRAVRLPLHATARLSLAPSVVRRGPPVLLAA